MELPHQLTSESVPDPRAVPAVAPRGSVRPAPSPKGWAAPDRDISVTVRLGLQQRASTNLRNHLVRTARRFTILVVADLAAFGGMREVLRAVREGGALGDWVASQVGAVVPPGTLNGWQYASALLVALLVTGNYGRGDARRDPRRLFYGCALATALQLWVTLWTRTLEPVAVQYALTTALVWGGLWVERRVIDRIVARVWPPARSAPATLFVGAAEECRVAMGRLPFSVGGEYCPVGFIDIRLPRAADALGHVADFAAVLHESRAETVVICGHLSEARFHEVVDAALASGCQVLSAPRAIEIAGVQPTLVWWREQTLIELTAPSLKPWQLVLKRCVDLLGATVGLLLAAPLMLLVALAIKLDSSGPVFFRQERIRTGGRRFRVWKFRTMRTGVSDLSHRELVRQMLKGDESSAGGEAVAGTVYKLVDDDRVTRIGRLLRRTSIDELPQLFNVLRGEMSLVGPRPPLSYELEQYDRWQLDRLQVQPGMTGLWQVSGRSRLTYRRMCELDVEYVRRWSLWLDLQILFRTVPVVLFNSGRAA